MKLSCQVKEIVIANREHSKENQMKRRQRGAVENQNYTNKIKKLKHTKEDRNIKRTQAPDKV